LSVRNHFDIQYGKILPRRRSALEQKGVLEGLKKKKSLTKHSSPTLHAWISHAFFFDDTGIDGGKLIWMNVVRDPVERFISNFNWNQRRASFRTRRLKIWGVNPEEYYNLNLDECAAANHSLCTWTIYPYGELQLSFFCGQAPACSERNNSWALQRAKYHVEKYYSVVGLLEEPSYTYALLEAYIPSFFQDIKMIKPEKVAINVAGSSKKKPVSNETRMLLRNNLAGDYEFYNYCRQRLYSQAKTLGLQ
ncbi:hypothetical protein SK128_018481, partial [Halocaridina rubra]